jgi:hypothetical protein
MVRCIQSPFVSYATIVAKRLPPWLGIAKMGSMYSIKGFLTHRYTSVVLALSSVHYKPS